MIPRTLEHPLRRAAEHFPVVTVTGPRQSGKTTLCRHVFGEKRYVSLENPDVRARALEDPRGFLDDVADGAILDEVQRAPDLLSYLQDMVDDDPAPGRFILTGSQHFGLLSSISQSLAGRTAVVNLLPLSFEELAATGRELDLFEVLYKGGYPRIHDRQLAPDAWLASYVATYVERDVRQVLNVGDLRTFQAFLALCAGRSAQLLNATSLGNDVGVAQKTVKSWLSVLETSFLVFHLPPYARNLGKRWIKSPKLVFTDSGLLCHLLGIRAPEQLRTHPLRGPIFESWVLSEILKARSHRAAGRDMYFWRDSNKNEVDLVLPDGTRAILAEIKSGMTFTTEWTKPLESFAKLIGSRDARVTETSSFLVYGGEERFRHAGVDVLPWFEVARLATAGS